MKKALRGERKAFISFYLQFECMICNILLHLAQYTFSYVCISFWHDLQTVGF